MMRIEANSCRSRRASVCKIQHASVDVRVSHSRRVSRGPCVKEGEAGSRSGDPAEVKGKLSKLNEVSGISKKAVLAFRLRMGEIIQKDVEG